MSRADLKRAWSEILAAAALRDDPQCRREFAAQTAEDRD
jgi:hypothetical protein